MSISKHSKWFLLVRCSILWFCSVNVEIRTRRDKIIIIAILLSQTAQNTKFLLVIFRHRIFYFSIVFDRKRLTRRRRRSDDVVTRVRGNVVVRSQLTVRLKSKHTPQTMHLGTCRRYALVLLAAFHFQCSKCDDDSFDEDESFAGSSVFNTLPR